MFLKETKQDKMINWSIILLFAYYLLRKIPAVIDQGVFFCHHRRSYPELEMKTVAEGKGAIAEIERDFFNRFIRRKNFPQGIT